MLMITIFNCSKVTKVFYYENDDINDMFGNKSLQIC